MGFGFQVVSSNPATGAPPVSRFVCARCGSHLDISLPRTAMSPDFQAKRARRAGWKADADRPSVCRCPACLRPASPPKDKEDAMALPSKEAGTVVPVTQPTAEQRLKIRSQLDKSFDDGVGRYLDGLSDQKIAEAVNVPRIVVEQIRETAYGPIRVNPVAAELRDAVAALATEFAGKLEELRKRIDRAYPPAA